MSWLGALKGTSNKPPEPPKVSPRTAKRNKLQADRLQRAEQREKLRKQFKAVQEAKEAADLAELELFALDPEIFEGAVDEEVSEDILEEEIEPAANMTNFDEKNEDNAEDAMKNLGQIKVNWDKDDPAYFFTKLETELQIFGINKQFTKRQALIRCLPDEVGKEYKHLTTLQEAQAGTLAYKTLKTAILKGYGPRPGDAFKRAMSRVMTGKPSTLLKLLISDICKQNLANNCCCNSTVWGIFQLQCPMYLKNGLANEVFNAANMQDIMDKADNFWTANQVTNQVSAVSAPDTQVKTSAEVSAVGRGRGNARSRGRGRGGRGRGNQSGPDPRGKRHESNPPWNSCSAHWVYADSAFKCQSPTTCPLKDKVRPRNQD